MITLDLIRDIRATAHMRRRLRVCPVVGRVDPAAQDRAALGSLTSGVPVITERLVERMEDGR